LISECTNLFQIRSYFSWPSILYHNKCKTVTLKDIIFDMSKLLNSPLMEKQGVILYFIFLILVGDLCGQPGGHYWNVNYGTKGQMLNGAVIGGVDDNSAIFYNPAAIGTDTVGGISLSLFSPAYFVINTNSSELNNRQLTEFDLLPSMLVVDFPFLQTSKLKTSIGIFSRRSLNIDFASQLELDLEAGQSFTGIVNFRDKISEDWIGFGMSYRINDEIQIGYNASLNLRSANQSSLINGEASASNPIAVLSRNYNSFYEYKTTYPYLSTKLGVLWHQEKYSLGLTATSPHIWKLYNSGSYQYIDPIFNEGLFERDNEATENDLNAKFKPPWSIGTGIVYNINEKNSAYFSAEYFSNVEEYSLIENEKVSIPFRLLDKSVAVFNIALGYELLISDEVTILSGFRSDFNSDSNLELTRQGDNRLFKFGWDIFHFSLGTHISYNKFKFSGGIDYGFSNSNNLGVFNPFQTVYESFQIDDLVQPNSNSEYRSLTFFLNYSLLFERFRTEE